MDVFGLETCSEKAASWQGKGDYSGIDNWSDVELKEGTVTFAGLPGQSPFYLLKESFDLANMEAKKLWQSVQVKPHDIYGYRKEVQAFIVLKNTKVATSTAIANSQYGSGEATQYYIENFNDILKTVGERMQLV